MYPPYNDGTVLIKQTVRRGREFVIDEDENGRHQDGTSTTVMLRRWSRPSGTPCRDSWAAEGRTAFPISGDRFPAD